MLPGCTGHTVKRNYMIVWISFRVSRIAYAPDVACLCLRGLLGPNAPYNRNKYLGHRGHGMVLLQILSWPLFKASIGSMSSGVTRIFDSSSNDILWLPHTQIAPCDMSTSKPLQLSAACSLELRSDTPIAYISSPEGTATESKSNFKSYSYGPKTPSLLSA